MPVSGVLRSAPFFNILATLKQPKLTGCQQAHLLQLQTAGEHTIAELAELFTVSRPTVY